MTRAWGQITAAAAGLLALTACASSDGSDMGQYGQVVRQMFRGGFGKAGVTLKQAAAIPYASMGWRLDGGAQNIIVLATDNEQGQLWTSAAHIVFLTQDGRIKRTVGLAHDMAALAPHGSGAMTAPGHAMAGAYSEQRTADFPDSGAFSVPMTCRGTARGVQAVTILGKKIATTRVEEHCEARTIGWSFTNVFWVDRESGFVWRSLQHIHPHGETIETEIFRPPG